MARKRKEADRRCDNRLTVIEAIGNRHAMQLEAWAVHPDGRHVRLSMVVAVDCDEVDFGWLIEIESLHFATVYRHEDAPGERVRITGAVYELGIEG